MGVDLSFEMQKRRVQAAPLRALIDTKRPKVKQKRAFAGG
jgi:hypothetical protein